MAPPRTMHWFRWYHGTADDGKLRLIAAQANTSVANVVAVWATMLEAASENPLRGNIGSWDAAVIGFALGIPADTMSSITLAMQGKVLNGQQLIAWNKRQPKREKADGSISEHIGADKDASEQNDTDDNKREPRGEESRVEENKKIPVSKKPKRENVFEFMGDVNARWKIVYPAATGAPKGTAKVLAPLFANHPRADVLDWLEIQLRAVEIQYLNLSKAVSGYAAPKSKQHSTAPDTDGYVIHDWRNDPLPVFEPGH